jgi:hypothetical protein
MSEVILPWEKKVYCGICGILLKYDGVIRLRGKYRHVCEKCISVDLEEYPTSP